MMRYYIAILALTATLAMTSHAQTQEELEAYYAEQAKPGGYLHEASNSVDNKNRVQALKDAGFEVTQTGGTNQLQIQGINGTIDPNGRINTGGYGTYQVGEAPTAQEVFNNSGGLTGAIGNQGEVYKDAAQVGDNAINDYLRNGQVNTQEIANDAYKTFGGTKTVADELGLAGNEEDALNAGIDGINRGDDIGQVANDVACAYFQNCNNNSGGGLGDVFGGNGGGNNPVAAPHPVRGATPSASVIEEAAITRKTAEEVNKEIEAFTGSDAGQAKAALYYQSPALAAITESMSAEARERFNIAMETYLSYLNDTSKGSEVRLATMNTCITQQQQEESLNEGEAIITCTQGGATAGSSFANLQEQNPLGKAYDLLKTAPASPVEKDSHTILAAHGKNTLCAGTQCPILTFMDTAAPSVTAPSNQQAQGQSGGAAKAAAPAILSADDVGRFTSQAARILFTRLADYQIALSNKYGEDYIRALSYEFDRNLKKADEGILVQPMLPDLTVAQAFFAQAGGGQGSAYAMNQKYQTFNKSCKNIAPDKIYKDYIDFITESVAEIEDQASVGVDVETPQQKLEEALQAAALETAPNGVLYPSAQTIATLANNTQAEAAEVDSSISLMKAVLGCQINHHTESATPNSLLESLSGKGSTERKEIIAAKANAIAALTTQQLFKFVETLIMQTHQNMQYLHVDNVGSLGSITMKTPKWIQEFLLNTVENHKQAVEEVSQTLNPPLS